MHIYNDAMYSLSKNRVLTSELLCYGLVLVKIGEKIQHAKIAWNYSKGVDNPF